MSDPKAQHTPRARPDSGAPSPTDAAKLAMDKAAAAKAERLAEALRANLRRRKAQARGRSTSDTPNGEA